jgi:hypothetical protein
MIEMQSVRKVFRTDLIETHALRSLSIELEPVDGQVEQIHHFDPLRPAAKAASEAV